MTPGIVNVHLIPTESQSSDAGWLLLSRDERARASSFVFPEHAAHWVSCRATLRRILGDTIHVPPGEVPLVLSPLGKPALAEPFDFLHFSLSHCKDLALLALCVDGPVGVDVERSARATDLVGCETTFCHPAELDTLVANPDERSRQLLDLWTAKEALLKALGTGFSHPPETIRIHSGRATSDTPRPGIENQVIQRLKHPSIANHCANLSAPASATRIVFHLFEASTSGDFSGIMELRSAKPDG